MLIDVTDINKTEETRVVFFLCVPPFYTKGPLRQWVLQWGGTRTHTRTKRLESERKRVCNLPRKLHHLSHRLLSSLASVRQKWHRPTGLGTSAWLSTLVLRGANWKGLHLLHEAAIQAKPSLLHTYWALHIYTYNMYASHSHSKAVHELYVIFIYIYINLYISMYTMCVHAGINIKDMTLWQTWQQGYEWVFWWSRVVGGFQMRVGPNLRFDCSIVARWQLRIFRADDVANFFFFIVAGLHSYFYVKFSKFHCQ